MIGNIITEQWIAAQPERHAPDGRRLFNCQNCRQEVTIPPNGLPVHRLAAAIRERNQQLQEAAEYDYADPNHLGASHQQTTSIPQQQPARLPNRGMSNQPLCALKIRQKLQQSFQIHRNMLLT